MPATWQSLATPGSTVADYLSHLPASTLPLSLHHFLKYSAESIKKESEMAQTTSVAVATTTTPNIMMSPNNKKKKKKKAPKEKKPRPKPGEIRLTTALDGSTLYCCPECHMAYPERELLEQHLLGHTLERRFVCDICGAGLKRKDHLTRHKQSHNPERPYVCTVCLKAFKRKEQLTLHFVIHSGEKRHVCTECGKGFYRKDHLRKHTRSHIARRVKAELSQNAGKTKTFLWHYDASKRLYLDCYSNAIVSIRQVRSRISSRITCRICRRQLSQRRLFSLADTQALSCPEPRHQGTFKFPIRTIFSTRILLIIRCIITI